MTLFRLQDQPALLPVVADQGGSRRDDRGGAAVVAHQLQPRRLRGAAEVEEEAGIAAAKAVDRLVGIADGEDPAGFAETADELVLAGIKILEFVDKELQHGFAHLVVKGAVPFELRQKGGDHPVKIDGAASRASSAR